MCVATLILRAPASASLMCRMYSTCCASGSPPIDATYRLCSGSLRYARLVSSSWRYVHPRSPEPPDLAIGGGQVAPELAEVGIDACRSPRARLGSGPYSATGSRLRHGAVRALLQEGERVAEDRLRDADLPVDAQGGSHELDVALLAPERDLHLVVRGGDPVERVDEVQVPRRPAELAVRHGQSLTSCCMRTTSRIASSSTTRSASVVIRPAAASTGAQEPRGTGEAAA